MANGLTQARKIDILILLGTASNIGSSSQLCGVFIFNALYMKDNQELLMHSFGHACLVVLYTSGVAWIIFNGQRLFGDKKSISIPIMMLMLFVVSAAIVGTLVLGRPALLYLDGKKTQALKMFGYTLGWLFLATIIFLLLNLK